mmetsp:Transcript_27956/g.59400  ORF Transcript_27956/g.59400 Transcript_27956/m.59400 type:complete len:82 (+) Transcript_27956:718-963(+)
MKQVKLELLADELMPQLMSHWVHHNGLQHNHKYLPYLSRESLLPSISLMLGTDESAFQPRQRHPCHKEHLTRKYPKHYSHP